MLGPYDEISVHIPHWNTDVAAAPPLATVWPRLPGSSVPLWLAPPGDSSRCCRMKSGVAWGEVAHESSTWDKKTHSGFNLWHFAWARMRGRYQAVSGYFISTGHCGNKKSWQKASRRSASDFCQTSFAGGTGLRTPPSLSTFRSWTLNLVHRDCRLPSWCSSWSLLISALMATATSLSFSLLCLCRKRESLICSLLIALALSIPASSSLL